MMITLRDRCHAFAASDIGHRFPDSCPSVSPSGRWIYGVWECGQNYRATSRLVGSYPPLYLQRVHALFPEVRQARASVLHVFSGGLRRGPYTRLDEQPQRRPDVLGSVYDAWKLLGRRFPLVCADPPYNARYAAAYGVRPLDRRRAMAAIARVCSGVLVWLDAVSPIFRKTAWRPIGKIAVYTGTNRICRTAFLFEVVRHRERLTAAHRSMRRLEDSDI